MRIVKSMTEEPVYKWQHQRIGETWQDMPDPHPNSPIAGIGDLLLNSGGVFDDGMGNKYRRIRVKP